MKRVLVTGASGFIGRHTLNPLRDRGFEVVGVYASSRPAATSEVVWENADLLNPTEVEVLVARLKPQYILHLAWFTTPKEYGRSLENLRWVAASLHLADCFVRNGGIRMTVAGTCAEYDWRYGYCSEALTPLKPSTLYGSCKNALQTALEGLNKEGALSISWARIFHLFGPHEPSSKLVSSVIRSLLSDQPAMCTDGKQWLDYLFVKDAADALVALLDSDVDGPVNVGSGIPVQVADLTKAIGILMQKPQSVHLGAILKSNDVPPLLVADVRRLREEVRWSPRWTLDAGLRRTIGWCEQNI